MFGQHYRKYLDCVCVNVLFKQTRFFPSAVTTQPSIAEVTFGSTKLYSVACLIAWFARMRREHCV